MNFDFSEEQKLLQTTARDFFAERSPLARVREVSESDRPYDEELWRAMAEAGYLGAAVPEEYGGAGFGYLELALLAEEVGRALAPVPFASSVYLATEALLRGGTPEQRKALLPALAAGERVGTFALTEGPGFPALEELEARVEGGRLTGVKTPVLDGEAADFAVVAARGADGAPTVVLADLHAEGVERKRIRSLDLGHSLARIEFRGAPVEPLGAVQDAAAFLERLVDRAAVLVAFEQLGGAARCLEMTREHTMSRYAFGRPVASFQALKHRMADMFCMIELARSNAYYGAWALENDNEHLPLAAALARAAASETYEHCAMEMIQMYGGVGFTWEYDCHLFLRRAKLLALLLGPPSLWKERVVQRMTEVGEIGVPGAEPH